MSAAAPTAPPYLYRVLTVVRVLIAYGKRLAATVQQRAATPAFAFFASPFGTADLAIILARITAGLRRAAALEAALTHRAASGRDLTPPPLRAPAARAPRAARPVASPEAVSAQDPRLARLPSEQEIAAEIRRRPVGAVIADICRDLGITPGQCDHAFWKELSHAIIAHGGNLASFFKNLIERLGAAPIPDDMVCPPWPEPLLLRLPAPATGPPS